MTKLNYQEWVKIGASETVLEWIKNGVPLKFLSEPSACYFNNQVWGDSQQKFVLQEILRLKQAGTIKEVKPEEVRCVLPIKCIPKPGGKHRLVLDCRHVNNFTDCDKFSQEGIESVG